MRIVVNILAYQIVWFACVVGAAAGVYAPGLAAAVVCVAWHVWSATFPRRELVLVLLAAALGAAFESALIASGWVRMPASALAANLTPLWMVALWATFATTLNVSLRSLRKHLVWASLLGAVGAPLVYHAGTVLGALQWVNRPPAMLAIALAWGALTPLLLISARRLDGYAT